MAKAHPLELGKRALALERSGMSRANAAAEIKTSKTFVRNVLVRYELTGSALPSK